MKRKARPNIKTQGAITMELLHQKEFKRTILLLYCKVPANYKVRFINKDTTLLKLEEEKKASDEFISEISENRRLGASDEKLEKIKNEHLKKWETNNPGKEQHLTSTFTFCVYDSQGTGAHLQDFKFLLPNADHDVRVSITKCNKIQPKAEEDLKVFKELIQDFKMR